MTTLDGPDSSTRLDKWLWAARFFKTRALAAEAIDGGRVQLNAERVKRSKAVRQGDEVTVRLGPYEHRVTVVLISERRGPATVAATLYEELPESRAAREALVERRRLETAIGAADPGRPSKRDRRQIDQLRRRGE
ncbi:MAG: RNA-binding S4 domain-containing protein [Gemmatimonadota bacterium]|nr:RNA-binding S4 domain-containing protein [Gemmatimonadota bacterium]